MNSPLPLRNPHLPLLRPDTSNIFQKFLLSELEEKLAMQHVDPLFMAYLQNKVAAYAEGYVLADMQMSNDPLKNQLVTANAVAMQAKFQVLNELIAEINDAQTVKQEVEPDDEEG